MWKLLTIGAMMGTALTVGGCARGPILGGMLPNSYIVPATGEPTARISFAAQSEAKVMGYTFTQSTGPFTPANNRQILMFADRVHWDSLQPHGSYNTINNSYLEVDRTITFSASGPLYFTANATDAYGISVWSCGVGFTFTPEPTHEYSAKMVVQGQACGVVLIDKKNGLTPASFRTYDPHRR